MKKAWKPLLVVVAVAMICGFGSGLILARLSAAHSLELARRTVLNHVEAVQREDFSAAYKLASNRVHEQMDEKAFAAVLRLECQRLIQDTQVEFGELARTDEDSLYAEVLFLHPDGTASPGVFLLLREDNKWKIRSLEMRAPRASKKGVAIEV